MRHQDMYVQPGYLIRRLHQRSTAEFAAATNGSDITQVQLSILLVVEDYPGIDATRISELIGSDRTTIGQALLRLEDKQLIRREVGTHDKRTKRLVITRRGRDLSVSIAQFVPSVGSAILGCLTQREQLLFMRLLTKIVAKNEGDRAIGKDLPAEVGSHAAPEEGSSERPSREGRRRHSTRESRPPDVRG